MNRLSAISICLFIYCLMAGCAGESASIVTKQSEATVQDETWRQRVTETVVASVKLESGELTVAGLFDGRDLSDYEISVGNFHDDLPALRDFIWKNWSNKKQAYARITFYSLEGSASTFHYFIEPDSKGRWRIACKIVRAEDLIHELPDAVSIEKVDLEKHPKVKGTYKLMFKDDSGEYVSNEGL